MHKLKVFLSDSFNPHLNLATEEWIFHHMEPDTQVLFLWRNEETVVIGRTQNPWSECNLNQMKADHVHLARRTTGGGAVFHDLKNTNFTFLSPREGYKRENNIQILLEALKGFGVVAEASGRNDLVMMAEDGPRKFSGSAYRETRDRCFHHGTLLIGADLTRLSRYLTPNPKKMKAKGKESVRARVMNLNEVAPKLDHEQLVPALVRSFENFYGGQAAVEFLSLESLPKIPLLQKKYEELSSWDWLYGRTLEFNLQMDEYFSLGFFDFHFQVNEALITDLQIYSDCLYPQLVDEMRLGMLGRLFESKMVEDLFGELKRKNPNLEDQLSEIGKWLIDQGTNI